MKTFWGRAVGAIAALGNFHSALGFFREGHDGLASLFFLFGCVLLIAITETTS